MKRFIPILSLTLAMLVGFQVAAQENYKVSGKVTDLSGEPLPGASVVVKGSNIGTTADIDGAYALSINGSDVTLICSFVGMKSIEAKVNGRTEINFSLEDDAIALDEVVAIGYGSVRKEDITSSITSVKSDNFLQGSVNSPLQLLQGKVAGLGISKTSGDPSGDVSVMLRGISTLAASASPLIVIDGVAGASLNAISRID